MRGGDRRSVEGAELAAKAGDIGVEGVVVDDRSRRPGGELDVGPADYFAGACSKSREYPKFSRRQLDLARGRPQGVGRWVQLQLTRLDPVLATRRPAHQRLQSDYQFVEGERL